MIKCDPKDIALKSFFLGPQSENSEWVRKEILRVIDEWFDWRRKRFPADGVAISKEDQASEEFIRRQKKFGDVVATLNRRFENETPKFTPRYIGHMVSDLSLSGILGHVIALLHNPNNASREAANVSEVIEKEAIGLLSEMIGFPPEACGHFTSGGTIANFEAMWRARYRLDHWLSLSCYLRENHDSKIPSFNGAHMGWEAFQDALKSHGIEQESLKAYSFVIQGPWKFQQGYRRWYGKDFLGPVILVPGNKHYSWQKGTSLMGFGDTAFLSIKLNSKGTLCIDDLKTKIESCQKEERPILMVVSVAGTTELGDVDSVDLIQDHLDELKSKKNIHIWHHVDAAYGGFFLSLQENLESVLGQRVANAFKAIKRVDSVTLDPHKLGYIPYSCGAIIVPNIVNNTVTSFYAPYLDNVRNNPQTWSSTIEGSRPGSGAAATWLTGKSLEFSFEGLGRILKRGIDARNKMRTQLSKTSKMIRILKHCDTNIVCFSLAIEGESLSSSNSRTESIFRIIAEGKDFSVSKTTLNKDNQFLLIEDHVAQFSGVIDCNSLILVRTVLMNPFLISQNGSVSYIDEFCSVVSESLGQQAKL